MTPKQRATLDFIGNYTRKNRLPPTFREIGTAMGVAHSGVHRRVMALVAHGLVTHQAQSIRSVKLTEKGEQVWSGSPAL